MNLKKHFQFVLIISALSLVFTHCAKMGSLTGGPKDEDPPVLVSSSPENYSTNFDRDRIEITFNEYIQLDNINQELVVSPPLENRPDVRLKSRSVSIELKNELRANTTYTLNFGQAIKDNNEGNVLPNFEFVFSTGDYLDSLSIAGTLLNAFNLSPPEEPVMVMLYDNLSDSVVYKDIPVYIGKTSKEGSYHINNLKADTFKLFALKDVNNNFLFDLPNEKIAFLDSAVIINPEFFSRIMETGADSLFTDTLAFPPADTSIVAVNDTILSAPDSLAKTPERIFVDLFLFEERTENQFLSDYNRKTRNKIDFSFNLPVSDSFSFQSLIPEEENWYLKEVSSDRDSFGLWIVNDEISRMDTLVLSLNYVVQDSMQRNVWKEDTLNFVYRSVERTGRKGEKKEEDSQSMEIEFIKNRETLDLNRKVKFVTGTPVNYVDTSRIEFYQLIDTLVVSEPYNMYPDTTHLRKIVFDKEWDSGAKYHLIAYPGAFMDVYGTTNDTLETRFSVREEGYYGTLIVNPDSLYMPMVVQLLDLKENLIRERAITENQEIRFSFLKPDKYKIKLVYDENGNGEWDTGKYIRHIQPERVQYYPGDIEVRANWELSIKVKVHPL